MVFEADFGPLHLIILALATYRISRFLVEDTLFSPVRDRIWAKFHPGSTKIGYFFTCYWCTSIWAASALVVCYILVPWLAIPVAVVLALSTVVGLIDHWMNN